MIYQVGECRLSAVPSEAVDEDDGCPGCFGDAPALVEQIDSSHVFEYPGGVFGDDTHVCCGHASVVIGVGGSFSGENAISRFLDAYLSPEFIGIFLQST